MNLRRGMNEEDRDGVMVKKGLEEWTRNGVKKVEDCAREENSSITKFRVLSRNSVVFPLKHFKGDNNKNKNGF